jgi:integrase/recombinase XerC
VLLGLDAGLRLHEIQTLRWSDIVIPKIGTGYLSIRAAIAKTDRGRRVPLSEALTTALRAWSARTRIGMDPEPNALVLEDCRGREAPTDRTISRWITAATMQATGEEFNPHSLRHTFATRLLKVADIRTVQELLGHRALSSTQVYTHVSQDDLRDAIRNREQAPRSAHNGQEQAHARQEAR